MFNSLIEKRRSIRKFQEKKIEPEKIEKLIEAALRSPSSRGLNPWEFVAVTDKSQIEKLSRAKEGGSAFLKNAPLAIVVCADPNISDVWVEDASIASIIIHLAAASLGLGSCWIQIRERPHDKTKTSEIYIREVLNIPARLKVESMIAIGYPDEEKPARRNEELLYEKVYSEVYGQKWQLNKNAS